MGSKHSSPVVETNRSGKSLGVSLPSDVLIMIFEDLNNMSPRDLSRLRLVSKQVDAVVVPMMYRNLVLTNDVVACFGNEIDDEAQLQVARDVCHHTRGVGMGDHRLSWPLVGNLLGSLEDLRCLSWSMIEPFRYGSFTYEDIICEKWPNAKLALAASTSTIMIAMEFPLPQLASCKIVGNSNAEDLNRAAVEDFVGGILEASSNLQRLHLVGGKTLAHVSARISAIQELVLEKYEWRRYPTAVPLQWDLTRLTHLELKNMIIRGFLHKVPPDKIPQLRSFKTDSPTQYPD